MTHQDIDRRSLMMHRIIATRLRAQPELIAVARANMARWNSPNGHLGVSGRTFFKNKASRKMNSPTIEHKSHKNPRRTAGAGVMLLVAGGMYAFALAFSIPKEIYAEHSDALRMPFHLVCFAGIYALLEMWRMNRRLKNLEERLSSMTGNQPAPSP